MSLSTDYYSKTTRPSTFREFIFTEESEADLNKYLSGTATFNSTNYTITYKNVTYQVAENGTLSMAEGLVLLDTLTLINGVDTSYQLTAEQKNIEAPSLSWTSSNPSVATVSPATGASTTVSVLSGATTNATSTITVSIKKVGQDSPIATDTCTIKAILSPYIDSSYVQYNVAYTDVYTGTAYNQNTGWRLITKIEEDTQHYNAQAGTYTGDIEIISTGIPAKLYYHYGSITGVAKAYDSENNLIKGKWAGDSTDRSNFVSAFYGTESNNNVYAASGLYYNFGNIIFDVVGETLDTSTISKEKGGYRAISNNGSAVSQSSTTIGDDLFKYSGTLASGTISGIRSVNLKDIKDINTDNADTITDSTDKRPGLFKLNDYAPDAHSSGNYWLASPHGDTSSSLRYVSYGGYICGYNDYDTLGVRPVVSITGVKMQKNGNVWQIVANSNS